jgi:transcriptional regulator of heat shock response
MGVLGPLRMDYRRTIRVVEEVSDALGDTLAP